MRVDPYTRPPVPPQVALLTQDGVIVSEHGERLEPDDWPKGTRCWSDSETVAQLVADGNGEALCWDHQPIRWRPERYEEAWRTRPSDVYVLRFPGDLFAGRPETTLRGLAAWRDWLGRWDAAPTGTSGSSAWSLLKATLDRPLFCSKGVCPPLKGTLGGRFELGPAGQGSFEGALRLFDLEAAYAREIAGLRYGGWWRDRADVGGDPELWSARGGMVFVRARIRLAGGWPGPLVRRPRRRMTYLEQHLWQLVEQRYPTTGVIQGVWTWQEVCAAVRQGARLLRVLDFWVHWSGRKPFEAWWRAIEEGRRLPGLAGTLGKVTGNALWGRFCMDPFVSNGGRYIRSQRGAKVEIRGLPVKGGLAPAHDLAETVSGRVRARLYELEAAAGERLLSAHTDGAWIRDPEADVDGWRLKQAARRLDLIDPQTLRYWSDPGKPWDPVPVVAGWPGQDAGAEFDRRWQAMLSDRELAA